MVTRGCCYGNKEGFVMVTRRVLLWWQGGYRYGNQEGVVMVTRRVLLW